MYLEHSTKHKTFSHEIFFTQKALAKNILSRQLFYFLGMLATIVKMTRPVNIVIAMVTLAIGYFLLDELPLYAEGSLRHGISAASLILQALGFAFAIGFGNIQNDVLDFESDKRNRPYRPLPSGKISMKAAKCSWISMLVLSISCGVADSLIWLGDANFSVLSKFTSALFFTALALLLVAYNKKLKHIPLLKNMTVATLCATPLLLNLLYSTLGGQASIPLAQKLGILYPAMLFAFLLTTAREIYKDLEDETGDLVAGIITFPIAAGAPTARRFAHAILAFTWLLLPLPVLQGFYPPPFSIITIVTLTPTFIYIVTQAKKQKYHKAQSFVKIAMFAGLISLVICKALF